jgi:hypothetical protein
MVFWNLYHNIRNFKPGKIVFESHIFKKTQFTSPTNTDVTILTYFNKSDKELKELRCFLRNNFGNPPKTPILDIDETLLLGKKDYILYIRDNLKNIIGCIRYHYIGIFITGNNENIYCVDCFCIQKNWRKKGIGDFLLTSLHNYVNNNNIPYSIFLKEGYSLNILHLPYYSSEYVFKKIENIQTTCVKKISSKSAHNILKIFLSLNPSLFIILNPDSNNQYWYLYEENYNKIVVCIQNTHQYFEEDNKIMKMAWITAWIESPTITDTIREKASIEFSNCLFPIFDYIWLNKEWIGNNNNKWINDGRFHWYLYQWVTNIDIKKSYCIMN